VVWFGALQTYFGDECYCDGCEGEESDLCHAEASAVSVCAAHGQRTPTTSTQQRSGEEGVDGGQALDDAVHDHQHDGAHYLTHRLTRTSGSGKSNHPDCPMHLSIGNKTSPQQVCLWRFGGRLIGQWLSIPRSVGIEKWYRYL
jgi:hypothetical protein